MILTGDNQTLLDDLVHTLGRAFLMMDLGLLHYFLSIKVHHTPDGLFLCQFEYAHDLLCRASMDSCKHISTPMVVNLTNFEGNNELYLDPTYYRSIVGALQYLTMTRPDLTYSVNTNGQYMNNPIVGHYQLAKHILRYVSGTLDLGVRIISKSTLDLYAIFCVN